MTPVRTPDVVRDVPGLLTYGMPVTFTAEGLDGERIECTGVVLDTPEPNTTWRVANLTDGVPADLYGDETRDMCPDWSSPLAIYAALHWLADRGRARLWMLPSTHGGRVEAWDGLSAWEVSAIVVSASVLRVAMGLGPVRDMLGPSVAWTASKTLRSGRRIELGHGGYARKSVATMTVTHTDDRRWFYGGGNVVSQSGERDWNAYPSADGWTTWEAHARDVTDRAALADGCALLAPSGILLPD